MSNSSNPAPVFKIEHNFLKNRLKEITEFKSKEEKIALMKMDEVGFSELSMILFDKSNKKPINDLEALAFIIKSIEISVHDIVDKRWECKKCKTLNEEQIELNSLINTDFESEIPIGLFSKLEDFIESPDDLILSDYNKYFNLMNKNNELILKLTKEVKCRKHGCNRTEIININPLEYISRVSLAGLYDEFFTLMYYLHMQPLEIENLIPFERELYLGMLKKKVESQQTLNIGV